MVTLHLDRYVYNLSQYVSYYSKVIVLKIVCAHVCEGACVDRWMRACMCVDGCMHFCLFV